MNLVARFVVLALLVLAVGKVMFETMWLALAPSGNSALQIHQSLVLGWNWLVALGLPLGIVVLFVALKSAEYRETRKRPRPAPRNESCCSRNWGWGVLALMFFWR